MYFSSAMDQHCSRVNIDDRKIHFNRTKSRVSLSQSPTIFVRIKKSKLVIVKLQSASSDVAF